MKTKSLTTIGALILIGAGGFMAGRISSPVSSGDMSGETAETRARRTTVDTSRASTSATERDARRSGRTQRGASPTSQEELARLGSILRGEDPLDRSRALLAFIDRLGPDDFEQAVAHFRSLGIDGSRRAEYAMLLSAWAKMDPLAALDYAKANNAGGFATGTVLATWATRDPDAALRWAEANHEGTGPNPHLAGIIRGIAETNPERATELLAGMPRSRERGDALNGMLPHMLAQGVEATRSWIEGLTDAALRDGAIMRSAEELASMDPSGTAAWLLANPGEATQRRMDDVYRQWARQDEQAALSAVTALPSGENRSNALRGVISSIATHDPAAALSVMNRFPNDVNDGVVQNFVWHSLGNDPATAVSQISRLGNARQQEWMYRRTLETWLDRDASAATAWIQSNPLPQPVLDRLANRLNGQP